MCATAAAQPEIADLVHAEMERWEVPGLAVGVLHEGRSEAWGFGVASIETRQPVTADTLFQIGSISKLFTATLAMQLVEAGTVDLDAPIASHLPELRLADAAAQGSVSLRHLLTHTAGFYGDRFDDFGLGDDALAKAVASFDQLRQYTAPGELWSYCNTGFQLAGHLVERLRGQAFETAARERLFAPLGLERCTYFAHEAITYPAAVGHVQPPGKENRIARPYPIPRAMNAAGGIIGTVGDLLRFAAFHMGQLPVDGVLGAESVRAMQQPQVEAALAPHWGLGWMIDTIDGARLIGHGGATNGFNARLVFVPERSFALAILTNSGQGSAAYRPIEAALLKRYLGLRTAEPPAITLPAESLARYAGAYERPLSQFTLTPADGGLRVEMTVRSPLSGTETVMPPYHAEPIGERSFRITHGAPAGSTFDFILSADGSVRFLRFGGRVSDPAPIPRPFPQS
ncbi:MAG TPA: serine hydrolase [Dehalococcoidia bacterium]|nr:serine hydrolase [Dehalococcoidia bacterium]